MADGQTVTGAPGAATITACKATSFARALGLVVFAFRTLVLPVLSLLLVARVVGATIGRRR